MRGMKVIIVMMLLFLFLIVINVIYTKYVIQHFTTLEYHFDYWDENYNIKHSSISISLSDKNQRELSHLISHSPFCIVTDSLNYYTEHNYIMLITEWNSFITIYIDHPGHSGIWKYSHSPFGIYAEKEIEDTSLFLYFEKIIAPLLQGYNRIGAG